MNIREFRAVMDAALRQAGFEAHRLLPRRLDVWSIPRGDLIRFFCPQASRRPWGFVYYGHIGIEIPMLREWLDSHKPGEAAGIFHTNFVGYHTANESALSFMVEHDEPVPADVWANRIKDRLLAIPASLDELVDQYRTGPAKLGLFAGRYEKPAWDFLLKWLDDPAPALHVPRMEPDGRIV